MKKSRFLWIRELPTKCREHEVREALQRFGEIQKVRVFKHGSTRYGIVAFGDSKGATQAINSSVKINDTLLKMEYCNSFDSSGNNLNKKSDSSHCQPHFGPVDKEQLSHDLKNTHDHISTLSSNDHLVRNDLATKRSNSRLVTNVTENSTTQVLRSVQNAANCTRTHGGTSRGLRLSNLPSLSKLKDAQLRQSLFTELRHCGHIQSVVLPPISNEANNESGRVAIVTFRLPEEAECAYRALQSGEKLLFSTQICAELHPGFESPDDHPVKSIAPASNNNEPSCTAGLLSKIAVGNAALAANLNSSVRKCPTRTLYVGGLTAGPTGPVTSDQLSTAFRKFGDIIDVKLQTSSNAALIQFAEMRGPMRAMNAHLRDPLRLGGRPLFLAYIPSPPSTGLWFSDLPPVLANMKDEELLRSLSSLAPVQEIILINRTESNSRLNQPSQQQHAPSTSVSAHHQQAHQPHYVAYIRMLSAEHASRLLSELRSGKHFNERPTPNVHATSSAPRRPFAVDFASARQTSLVASLQINAARSITTSGRIRVISATSLDLAKRLGTTMVPHMISLTNLSSVPTTHAVPRSTLLGVSSPVRSVVKSDSPTSHRSGNQRSTWDLYPGDNTGNSSGCNTVGNTFAAVENGLSDSAIVGTHPNGSSDVSHTRLDSRPCAKISVPKEPSRSSHTGLLPTTTAVPIVGFRNTLFTGTQSLDRMDAARDSSPSSLSTSSSSSSLSSESSESSSSSSSSESSSSSSSSSVSSPTSLSGSSARSRTRRSITDPSVPLTKSNQTRPADAARLSPHQLGTSPQNSFTTMRRSHIGDRKPPVRTTSESSSTPCNKAHAEAIENAWLNERNGAGGFARRQLSVVTTIAPTVSSPIRSSAASSDGLSSPVCVSALPTACSRVYSALSNNTSLMSSSAVPSQMASSCHTENHHHSMQSCTSVGHHATSGELHVCPVSVPNSSSASSGVSSCGRSFSSSNSSTGSSPFNHCNVVTSHQISVSSKLSTSIAPNHAYMHKIPSTFAPTGPGLTVPVAVSQLRGTADANMRHNISHSNAADRKARVYSSENTSGLKLHISTGGNLVPPQSSAPAAAVCSPLSTPLTVSIRLSGSEIESHNAIPAMTSPSAFSAHEDVFCVRRSGKCGNSSHPTTPSSAPPHITNVDTGRRFSSQSMDMCDKTPLSDSNRAHVTDWFSLGSPVYESMYDKIKRRTNKEAEERRQRQQETLDAREKKHRKQRRKDQLTRSPPSVSFTPPESFGSEHSAKTAGTNSSDKSRCSKSDSALRKGSKRLNSYLRNKISEKDFLINGGANDYHSSSWHSPKVSPREPTWSTHTSKSRPTELTSKSVHKHARKSKRSRRERSSISSSLSSGDDRNSCSPPGTLTRLSLGMRFPVSATYHECVRPKSTHRSEWSPERDDDSLSHLSSSLSCSSSDGRSDHPPSDNSKQSITVASTFPQFHCRAYDVLGTKHGHVTSQHVLKRDSSGSLHSPVTKSSYRKGREMSPVRNELSSKKSQIFDTMIDRPKSTVIDKRNKPISGSKRKREECPNKQSFKRHRVSHKILSTESSHGHIGTTKQTSHHGRSPKVPYLPDCVLDSEVDDIRCSDSVSHNTGTSDPNVRSGRPDAAYRNRRISSSLHSGTDDSSVCGTHSPSPIRGTVGSPLHLTSHYRKQYSINTSICSDPHSRLVDDRDSIFDVFMDSDRFSPNSKSTPSTEPMEQSEIIERNLDMKFSDDEWHSSVVSTSPNPNNMEFDVDYCRGDTKTEHSSTTYQSTSFSSQLISPVCKLRSPSEDESDDESLHKAVVDFTKPCGTSDTLALENLHNDPTSTKFGTTLDTASSLHEVSSPIEPEMKPQFISSHSEDLKIEAANENGTVVTSPLRPDSPLPIVKPDFQPTSQSLEEDSKPDRDSLMLKTDVTKTGSAISFGESALPTPHMRDSIHSTESEAQDTSHESSVPVQESTSFEMCANERSERKPAGEDSGTNASVTIEPSSDDSAPLESIVSPAPACPFKGEIELSVITSPPVRVCSQTMEKPVGQSTPKVDCNPPCAALISRAEARQVKTNTDEPDITRKISVVAPMQSPVSAIRAHATVSESTKTTNISHQPSSGPPTEVHDITRYVQSVIERVKAERVEESQQAAAAAAQYHTSGAYQTSSGVSLNASQASAGRSLHDGASVGPVGTGSIGGKRGSVTTRRPLLVSTSACTSVKPGGITSSTKWSSSATSGQSQSSTSLTFCGTTVIPTVACHHPPNTCTTSATAAISIVSSQTSDLHLPLIPGVNACAPMAVSPQLTVPVATGRVTRQSQQQNGIGSMKRPETSLSIGDIQPNSAKTNNAGNGRRRRRSESKVSLGCVSKEISNNLASLLPNNNTLLTSSEAVLTHVVNSGTSGPTVTDIVGKSSSIDEQVFSDLASESGHLNNQVIHNTSSVESTHKGQASIDPYEPNFDEESPVGFEHGQLHHHRSTPPICPSPTPSQPNTTSNARKQVNTTTSVIASCTSPSSDNSILSPVSNTGCEGANNRGVSTNSANVPITITNTNASITVPSPVTTTATSDTVDEVIRDVCAGQFDVRSYMNSWRAECPSNTSRQSSKNSPRITAQSHSGAATTTTAAVPLVANIMNSVATSSTMISCTQACTPTSSVVSTVQTTTPMVTVSNTTATVPVFVPASMVASVSNSVTKLTTSSLPNMPKSFPLAISEPVVAAVTIPVSSNGAKTIAPGKNGSNNVVNIATGNALLNTLLAALQRIPGSQVTVGGVGSGAISATTITLPVNAARQAAANITAAVLSATGGGAQTPISEPPQETISSGSQIEVKDKAPDGLSKPIPASFVSCVKSSESVILHRTSPINVSQSTQRIQQGSKPLPEPITNNIPQANVSMCSVPHLPNKLQPGVASHASSGITMHPKRVLHVPSEPIFIDAPGLPAKSVITAQQQQHSQIVKTTLLDRPLPGVVPASRPALPPLQFNQTGLPHLPVSAPMPIIPPGSLNAQPPLLPTSSGASPSPVTHHPNMVGLLKPSQFATPVPTQPQSAPARHASRILPTAPPLVPGRSPPTSAPPLTGDAVQALLERFGGAFEPSVLMVIAQAAAAGAGPVENNLTGSDGENTPALTYLRRWAQQMLESRQSVSNKHPTTGPVDGPIKSAPPHVTTPPISTAVSVLSFPSQPRMSQLSALSVNTLNSDTPVPTASAAPPRTVTAVPSAPTVHETNASLISPPVGTTRHSPNNIPLLAAAGVASSANISCNTIGQTYPLVWQGRLSLKNAETRVALHYIHGNPNLLHDCMRLLASGGGGQPQHSLVSNGGPLRIVQRMRLEPAQLEGVQRKIHQDGASCACLALPAGNSTAELIQQTQVLNESFIRYMQEKMAAGIINVGFPEYQQGLYVVHIFPPCEFSHAQLNLAAPELYRRVLQANQSHLLVVITTV
ncbi:Msx2-interacting protein [Fasciola hepatica]|uniref:Msx2-interacting protein n=1 Tax=Fasciola hepatica TaxID=6192 RepID=A0A4E0RZC5_FASHE|nr:Msx2-interacting protein [Fasciola hepatica]